MYILKTIFLYLLTSSLPLMLVYLSSAGIFRIVLLSTVFTISSLIFIYADKFILLFLGAREVIDADNQTLFQALKSETYREHESFPKVYLYSGHRVKAFVLNSRSTWSVVLDRSLIKSLNQEQIEALVSYLIRHKKEANCKIQTLGMGVSSVIIRMNYWIWDKFGFDQSGKTYKSCVFITFVMIKPLIDIILNLTKSKKKVMCKAALKSVYLQVDQSILDRSFIEFMVYHLETKINLSDITIEFLEEFPLLENCKFEEYS
jgi:hypothetical protein